MTTALPRPLAGSLYQIPIRAASILLLALALTACTTTNYKGGFPTGYEVPRAGGRLSPAIWNAAAESQTEASPSFEKRFNWFFPLTTYQTFARFQSPELLGVESLSYNGIGTLFLFLPVRITLDQHYYTPESGDPAYGQKLRWNLFWTRVKADNWPEGSPRLESWGIPLLFSHTQFASASGDYENSVWNALWSLGPVYTKFRVEPNRGEDQPEAYVRGYAGLPLALAGGLGSILWTDVAVRVHDPNDDARVNIHGPLFGLLGFINVRAESIAGSEESVQTTKSRVLLLLGGLLWTSSDSHAKIQDEPGRLRDRAINGPLWAMFGWGRKDTRPTIRFFWIHIPVGKGQHQPPPDPSA